ncbi:hypothetical protein [Virgibacillus phasianinus]|uniref:hypothetical protein n=1 Tax=Virgibacillus phasianinus TaxID=2017483 RepID=UPI00156134EB|nr:hypothetical protein [Virgibacillus phasianinus]
MESFYIFFPFLMWLIFLAVGMFVLYLVVQAAVRNGINTSIVGKRMKEQNEKNPKI